MYDFFNTTCPLENSAQYDQDSFWTDGHQWDAHRIGWLISGIFAFVDTVFAFTLIFLHLRNYNKPEFQRYYVRIILLIPVYAVVSWLSYRFYRAATYYEFGRDAYESIVICSFMILMCNFLGSEMHSTFKKKQRGGLIFPLCCIKVNPSSWYFVETIKWCVLQFAVINPAVSVTAIILQTQNLLCPESLSLAFGNSWLSFVKILSVTLATYALIEFYFVIRHDVATHKPLLKFLSIKLIIFLTFYQSFIFELLAHFGVIHGTEYWTVANVENGLSAFAITVEMLLFAILFVFAYPWKEFRNPDGKKTNVFKAAVDAFNIFDLFVEVYRNFRWLFLAVVLRRPYPKDPDMDRMDVYGAMMGTRNTAGYGKTDTETYAMLNVPQATEPPPQDIDMEGSGYVPSSLRPANGKYSDREDEEEDDADLKPSPSGSDPPAYPADFTNDTSYTNMYGQELKGPL